MSRMLPRVPWITAEGAFDPAQYPIDSTLRQCLTESGAAFRSCCMMLAMMAARGRVEAGVFLLGLLRYYEDNLSILEVVVESLGNFHDTRCAAALCGELRRVPSSNKTRRYLGTVIKCMARLPVDMVQERFAEMAADAAFSYKMRAKFKAAAAAAA